MKNAGRIKRLGKRAVCLLLCLVLLSAILPVTRTEATEVKENLTWHWDRLDTLTDISPQSLERYTSIMFVYYQYDMYRNDRYTSGNCFDYSTIKRTFLLGYNPTYREPHTEFDDDRFGYYHFLNGNTGYYAQWNPETHDYSGAVISSGGDPRAGSITASTIYGVPLKDGTLEYNRTQLWSGSSMPMSFDTTTAINGFQLRSLEMGSRNKTFSFSMSYASSVDDNYFGKLICGKTGHGSLMELVDEPTGSQFSDWTIDYNDMPYYSTAGSDSVAGYNSNEKNNMAFIWHDQEGNVDSFWGTYRGELYFEGVDFEANLGKAKIVPSYSIATGTIMSQWSWSGKTYYTDLGYKSLSRFYVYVGYEDVALPTVRAVTSGSVTTIEAGRTMVNSGELLVEAGGVLNVKGTLINNGTIRNYGTIYVRDGGTITNNIIMRPHEDTASIYCLDVVAAKDARPGTLMAEGSPTEGSLVIDQNGRVIIGEKGTFALGDSCTVQCNGELIYNTPAISGDNGALIHVGSTGTLFVGTTLIYRINQMSGCIRLATSRRQDFKLTLDEFKYLHPNGSSLPGWKGTDFYSQLVMKQAQFKGYLSPCDKSPAVDNDGVVIKP